MSVLDNDTRTIFDLSQPGRTASAQNGGRRRTARRDR